MNSLPFHIKEAESVFSLKTQLKFFFFFFALQSFSKPLFNQETECILPSESSRYYKKFETKKRRKERKKGKDEKKSASCTYMIWYELSIFQSLICLCIYHVS